MQQTGRVTSRPPLFPIVPQACWSLPPPTSQVQVMWPWPPSLDTPRLGGPYPSVCLLLGLTPKSGQGRIPFWTPRRGGSKIPNWTLWTRLSLLLRGGQLVISTPASIVSHTSAEVPSFFPVPSAVSDHVPFLCSRGDPFSPLSLENNLEIDSPFCCSH